MGFGWRATIDKGFLVYEESCCIAVVVVVVVVVTSTREFVFLRADGIYYPLQQKS